MDELLENVGEVKTGCPPATSPKDELQDLCKRVLFEHELLVNRTAAILALNGLMAATVAAATAFPWLLKGLVAATMILIDLAWLLRAGAARNFIEALNHEIYSDKYAGILPVAWKIHKASAARRRVKLFNTTTVFSIGIPFLLFLCWIVGLAAGTQFEVADGLVDAQSGVATASGVASGTTSPATP
jgi:hypothetical protein